MIPWIIAAMKLGNNLAQGQQKQANSLNYNMNQAPVQQSSGSNAIGNIASIFGDKKLW